MMDESTQTAICGAQLRGRPGVYCQQRVLSPNGRCRLHGGNSPAGIECGAYKHGLYSKYVPKTMRREYDAILEDHDLTELREELALQTLRMTSLIMELEKEPPPWEELQVAFRAWAGASESSKMEAMNKLVELVQTGVSVTVDRKKVWEELRQIIQEKTRTASAEWGRLHDLNGLVKLETVMAMWRGMLEAVREKIPDREQLKDVVSVVMKYIPPSSQIEYIEEIEDEQR